MTAKLQRVPYSSERRFINRNDPIELVTSLVERVSRGERPRRRVVIIYGERGTGKSWLLQHLDHLIASSGMAVSCYLDLRRYQNQPPARAGDHVSQILQKLAQVLDGGGLPAEADCNCWSDLVVDKTRELPRPLLLLVDHVTEMEAPFLELLEAHLLAQLSAFPHVLILLAERGRGHGWKAIGLRLHTHPIDLAPFSAEETLAQLQDQVPRSPYPADEIHGLGGGFPWANYLLAEVPRTQQVGRLDQIVEGYINGQGGLRPIVETLSVLRHFTDSHIEEMVNSCHEVQRDAGMGPADCTALRQRLVDAGLARWSKLASQYKMDEALQRVLISYLEGAQKELLICLHCAAFCMYRSWAQKYDPRWQHEADHHSSELLRLGVSAQDCTCPPDEE